MLMWHRKLQLIDQGAALYFHHSWDDYLDRARDRFVAIKDHVLLKFASDLAIADTTLSALMTETAIRQIVELIPDSWLSGDNSLPTPSAYRDAYVQYLLVRLKAPRDFVEEAIRARSMLV
jgi:hypothetical protein